MTDLQLDTLEARGLIRIATYQPELEYLFRHALLQDTAYESLLKQERRSLHQVVGQAIEELYPERMGELAAVLAMHFEEAGDKDKAIEYLVAAASFAVERNAITEGFELYGRAAALLPPPSPDDAADALRRRIGIQLGRTRAGFTFMSEEDSLSILEPVLADVARLGDLRLDAEVNLTIALLRQLRGENPDTNVQLRASLERISDIARELDDPLIAALPESIVGLVRVGTGDLRAGVELLEKTAPQLEQKHDFVGSSFAMVSLAMGLARLGEFERAEAAARGASELAEKGDLIAKLDAMIGDSMVRSIKGDLDGAVPIARQCTDMAEQTGAVACVVVSNYVLGDAFMRQGRFGDAKLVLERSNEVAGAIQEQRFHPSIAAYLRSNAASLGEGSGNTPSFDEALSSARQRGDRWNVANVLWQRAETEAKRADGERNADQMLDDFAAAQELFSAMEARPFRARTLRSWGNALRALGRRDDGDAKLRQALTLFDELGITREADAVREALAGQ